MVRIEKVWGEVQEFVCHSCAHASCNVLQGSVHSPDVTLDQK